MVRHLLVQVVITSILLLGCLTGESRGQAAPKPVQNTPSKTQTTELSEKDALPLLVTTLIQPVTEKDQFKIDSLSIEYLRDEKPIAPAQLFANVDEAVTAAKKWIVFHFGDSPANVTLQLKDVEGSRREPGKPFDAHDPNHTVEFRQTYRGIPTSRRAVFIATGHTPTRVIIELSRFEPIAGSAKVVVRKDIAIKAWRDLIAAKHAEKLEEFDNWAKTAKPELRYEWSPMANQGLGDHNVFAPTWVLDGEGDGLFMVDGQSGKPWYND